MSERDRIAAVLQERARDCESGTFRLAADVARYLATPLADEIAALREALESALVLLDRIAVKATNVRAERSEKDWAYQLVGSTALEELHGAAHQVALLRPLLTRPLGERATKEGSE